MSDHDVVGLIRDLVASDLPSIPPLERAWVERHLADPPRLATFAACDDGTDPIRLWLVTDHTGDDDASCRVVFDPGDRAWGLEMTLEGGIEWFMGFYAGGFADVVDAM